MRRTALLLALGACLLAACGDEAPAPPRKIPAPVQPPPEPASRGSLAAFDERMQRLLQVCAEGTDAEAAADVRDLLLPQPERWFRATFGDEHAEALVREYAQWEARVPQLPAEVNRNRAAGKTHVLTERYESWTDDMATTFQSIALRKMKARTPLYSLRLVEPGMEEGWHLWSFAFVDGEVRFVGRLMALTPIAADRDLVERGSWRKKVEREDRLGK